MGSISKSFSLLLIVLLAVSSLIMAKPAFAQNPTPSVPTFTVQPVVGNTGKYSYVVVTIKNQPYNSSYGSLYYNIQISPHGENSWTDLYQLHNQNFPTQSDADYTNISIPVEDGQNAEITIGFGQTDIQVQAMLGNIVQEPNGTAAMQGLPSYYYSFIGYVSGWSNTQTVTIPVTIPANAPTTSTSTSTQTHFSY